MLSTLYIFIKERDANAVCDAKCPNFGIIGTIMTASQLKMRQDRKSEGGCC